MTYRKPTFREDCENWNAAINRRKGAHIPRKGEEGENNENPFLRDYRFFKYLYTTIPDNTKLRKILARDSGAIIYLE